MVGPVIPAGVGGERPGPASSHTGLPPAPQWRAVAARFSLGSIFYLCALVIVAVVTVGTFFGLGLFLLVHHSAVQARAGVSSAPAATVSLPTAATPSQMSRIVLGPDASVAKATALPEKVGGSLPGATASDVPAAAEAPPAAPSGGPDGTGAGGAPEPAGTPDASRPGPAATAPAASTPHADGQHVSAAEIRALLALGAAFFRKRDMASARLFYQRAADAGNGQAALRMGETYDPAFLGRGRRRIRGDQTEARFWYGRALELGAPEAGRRLTALETRSPR
jgi:hypothetical protein